MLAYAFHDDFVEDGESDSEFHVAELFDLGVGAWLLSTELVGGEGEDEEALIFVFVIDFLEAGVLRGESTLGGDVDDEEDFVGVVGLVEVHGASIEV